MDRRKGKGCLTVFSDIWLIHKSLQTHIWIVYMGSTAEQKPLKLEVCHGGEASSRHEGKAGTRQGSRRYRRKGLFTITLLSLV